MKIKYIQNQDKSSRLGGSVTPLQIPVSRSSQGTQAVRGLYARHCDLEANRHNLYDERKHDCYTICEQPSHFHKLNGRTTQILSFPTIKL